MSDKSVENLIVASDAFLSSLGKLSSGKYKSFVNALQRAREREITIHGEPEPKLRYLNYAQEQCQDDGAIEFDDNAEVSLSEASGAYVQGWFWIPASDAGMCSEEGCHRPTNDGEGFDGKCGNCADKKDTDELKADNTFCSNEGCCNRAVKVVRASVKSAGDHTRGLCNICVAAYSLGVQHGTIIQNPDRAKPKRTKKSKK